MSPTGHSSESRVRASTCGSESGFYSSEGGESVIMEARISRILGNTAPTSFEGWSLEHYNEKGQCEIIESRALRERIDISSLGSMLLSSSLMYESADLYY